MGVPGSAIYILFEKKVLKRSVQRHVFAQSTPGRRPKDKHPVNTSHRSDLPKNVSLQCYLVATVIHIQFVRSQIVYTHTHNLHNLRHAGTAKER